MFAHARTQVGRYVRPPGGGRRREDPAWRGGVFGVRRVWGYGRSGYFLWHWEQLTGAALPAFFCVLWQPRQLRSVFLAWKAV